MMDDDGVYNVYVIYFFYIYAIICVYNIWLFKHRNMPTTVNYQA